ncbi:MAG: MoaD/ThiS family protein [Gammaproteobacteria bacterium]|nr:MoaD/ThiS family protein [Gammaproteobacteria bacterium]
MSIRVKFFASIAERTGCKECAVEYREGMTVQDVWQTAAGANAPRQVLMAINMEYCEGGQGVADGDEVAFFPPVTGG